MNDHDRECELLGGFNVCACESRRQNAVAAEHDVSCELIAGSASCLCADRRPHHCVPLGGIVIRLAGEIWIIPARLVTRDLLSALKATNPIAGYTNTLSAAQIKAIRDAVSSSDSMQFR